MKLSIFIVMLILTVFSYAEDNIDIDNAFKGKLKKYQQLDRNELGREILAYLAIQTGHGITDINRIASINPQDSWVYLPPPYSEKFVKYYNNNSYRKVEGIFLKKTDNFTSLLPENAGYIELFTSMQAHVNVDDMFKNADFDELIKRIKTPIQESIDVAYIRDELKEKQDVKVTWYVMPIYEKKKNQVLWCAHIISMINNTPIENRLLGGALILGREGFINLGYIGKDRNTSEEIKNDWDSFTKLADTVTYYPGHQYSEYKESEAVASLKLEDIIAPENTKKINSKQRKLFSNFSAIFIIIIFALFFAKKSLKKND